MNVTSTGLAGSAIQLIRSDAAGDAIWDSTDGTGRFAWDWNHGSARGAVLGPIPSTGFSMTFKASSWKNVATVRLASFDPTTNDISFVSIDTADALGDEKLLKVNGHSCTNFCQLQSSCGECTASQFCGWCGATSRCLSNADISDGNAVCPSDYTQPLNSCNVCLQQMTASACLQTPGCGFLFDKATPENQAGFCVSGTPTSAPSLPGSELDGAGCAA